MKWILFLIIFLWLLFPLTPVFAQEIKNPPPPTFIKGKVIKVTKEQDITVRIRDAHNHQEDILIKHDESPNLSPNQKLNPGDSVILSKYIQNNETHYRIADKYRLNTLIIVIIGFFLLVIALSGRKGAGAILGLFISLLVIALFIVPQIMAGHDALLVSMLGALFIMITTMYLAHGFTQRTTVAVVGTFISLLLTAGFAILFVWALNLSGLGSEDIYSLQQGFKGIINFQGLLLGGIIIGALGVLDDVTTTQSATIYTLATKDPKLTTKQLFKSGFAIGREHITSVVNTLVLAYAGASIGVFIFLILAMRSHSQPLWVILNSELIVEEVVRSLAGSIGLILAVPNTTILAAFFSKYSVHIK